MLRKRTLTLMALALFFAMVLVSTSPVAATACAAQLGDSSQTNPQYYTSNSQIIVPVAATCFFSGGQLYAVGNLFNPSTDSNLGSTNTTLISVNGGNTFIGQLVFGVPPLMQGQSLRISVSIFSNGFNGPLQTSATQTAQIFGANFYQPAYPWYPYQWWPYYPSYPYQWYPRYPGH